jgi:ubiquitin carboxyl-terminal hydrolase 22/27/51
MDTIAVAPKGAPLASPKVVKNAKGALVPSSQMAHIAYGCGECSRPCKIGPADGETEHMGEMLEVARKQTFRNYHAILQDIHEKPSIIAQTYKDSSDGRPVVSLRPLYLCLQCPNIMTEADRDEHIDVKRHVFCAFFQS